MSGTDTPDPASGAARHAQLAIEFPLRTRTHFANFVTGMNRELVRRLEQMAEEDARFQGFFLFGASGVGRTHLLQAACHHQGGRHSAIYLPLKDPMVTPALLDGLDELHLVALDDLESWIGQPQAEAALLALYQGLLAAGGRLLVSAGVPAGQLSFRYADLASRIRGLSAYQVRALDDAGKARVLQRLAGERGLELPAQVLDFWLVRSSRDLAGLLDQFDRLDAAAMAAQRRLTVPLVKQVLGL